MIKGGGHWYALLFVFSFFFVFIYFIFLFNSDFSWLDSATRYSNKAWSSLYLKIYGILTLPVHHDWIQVFMESVLFIYVFFFSSCVSLPIVCPSMISYFRCSGPFFGEKTVRFLAPYYTCYSVNFQRNKAFVGLSDYRIVRLLDCRIIGRTPILLE